MHSQGVRWSAGSQHSPSPGRSCLRGLCAPARPPGLRVRATSGAPRPAAASQQHAAPPWAEPPPVAAATVAGAPGPARPRRCVPFDERCRHLEAFVRQHGHCAVPMTEETGLGTWLTSQRHAWRTGRLALQRQQRLAALGASPDAQKDAWAERFAQLAAFHSQFGHCRVPPAGWAEAQFPGLYRWLRHQLHKWRQGTLADERRRRLAGLGVEFEPHAADWEARFQELARFQQEYGHADVPHCWPANQSLALWVAVQRRRWRGAQGAPLSADQQSRLLGIGFRFDTRQDEWDRRYAQLCELKVERGGELLGRPMPREGGLAYWVHAQLARWRDGSLPPERASRLEALGLSPAPPSPADRPRKPSRSWRQRVAVLDQLVACLGFPAAHALLALADSSAAPPMAAELVASVQSMGSAAEHGSSESSSSGASSSDWLTSEEAEEVVRWHSRLRASKLRPALAQALAARGLLPAR